MRADLEEGYELWASHADIESFALGRTDARGQLSIPKRLYGRDDQIKTLNTLLDRATRSEVAIARILGGAGVGKSAFIDFALSSIAERHGLAARVRPAPDQFAQRPRTAARTHRPRSSGNCCRVRRPTSMRSSRA